MVDPGLRSLEMACILGFRPRFFDFVTRKTPSPPKGGGFW